MQMLSALALAAMVSLSKAERDAYYDKPPQNTLRDCGTEPQPYGECRLPPGLSAQDIETRLAGKNTAWWRDGDQFVIVARRDTAGDGEISARSCPSADDRQQMSRCAARSRPLCAAAFCPRTKNTPLSIWPTETCVSTRPISSSR